MNGLTSNILFITLVAFIVSSCSSHTKGVLTEDFSGLERNNSILYKSDRTPQAMYQYGNRSYYLGGEEIETPKSLLAVLDNSKDDEDFTVANQEERSNVQVFPKEQDKSTKDSVKQEKELIKTGQLQKGNMMATIIHWRAKMVKKVLASTPYALSPKPRVEGLALAGFIIGIVSLFYPVGLLSGALLSLLLGALAITFGAVSIVKIDRKPTRFKGRGFAITAMITGIISLAFWAVLLIYFIY